VNEQTGLHTCSFLSPTKILFGIGAVQQIGKEVTNLGGGKPFWSLTQG
jgi:hypothetical protein